MSTPTAGRPGNRQYLTFNGPRPRLGQRLVIGLCTIAAGLFGVLVVLCGLIVAPTLFIIGLPVAAVRKLWSLAARWREKEKAAPGCGYSREPESWEGEALET